MGKVCLFGGIIILCYYCPQMEDIFELENFHANEQENSSVAKSYQD